MDSDNESNSKKNVNISGDDKMEVDVKQDRIDCEEDAGMAIALPLQSPEKDKSENGDNEKQDNEKEEEKPLKDEPLKAFAHSKDM